MSDHLFQGFVFSNQSLHVFVQALDRILVVDVLEHRVLQRVHQSTIAALRIERAGVPSGAVAEQPSEDAAGCLGTMGVRGDGLAGEREILDEGVLLQVVLGEDVEVVFEELQLLERRPQLDLAVGVLGQHGVQLGLDLHRRRQTLGPGDVPLPGFGRGRPFLRIHRLLGSGQRPGRREKRDRARRGSKLVVSSWLSG